MLLFDKKLGVEYLKKKLYRSYDKYVLRFAEN